MTSAIRLRLLVATPSPAIVGYDQDEFARRLFYDRPVESSLEALKAARRTTAARRASSPRAAPTSRR